MKVSNVIISALSAALVLSSCGKSKVDTDYTMRLSQEYRKSNAVAMPIDNAQVWAANIDAADWTFDSYSDVNRAGGEAPVATSRKDGSKHVFDIQLDRDASGAFKYEFAKLPIMIVAFDEDNPMYVYGDANLVANLTNLFVGLRFEPWKSNSSKTIKPSWHMVHEDTKVPVECKYTLTPRVVNKSGGSQVAIPGMVVYALVADTAEWYVANVADALDGRLTKKGDTETREYSATTDYKEVVIDPETDPDKQDGKVLFDLGGNERKIMFVFAHPTEDLFAYGGADLYENSLAKSEQVTFQIYKGDGTYDSTSDTSYEGKWVIKFTGFPQEPEEPEEPQE